MFASFFIESLPELKQYARMVARAESDEFDFLVEIPSPSGDKDRQVVIWMAEGIEPSVGFGEWHTHAGVESKGGEIDSWADVVINLVRAILADEVVLINDVGGEHDGHWGLIDFRRDNALLDELTSRFSPGQVRIRSWSGRNDREIGLEDLRLE